MAILSNRVKIRTYCTLLFLNLLTGLRSCTIFILLILDLCLIYNPNILLSQTLLDISGRGISSIKFIYNISLDKTLTIKDNFLYFKEIVDDRANLRLELKKITELKTLLLQLKKENKSLRELLNVRTINTNLITAKVIGISQTPFGHYGIINIGKKDGVKKGDVIQGRLGLVGRIDSVGRNYSKAIVIGDNNLRVPVFTQSGDRGVFTKQNSSFKLNYVPKDHNINIGELVYSSGEGVIFPRNIPVAIVDSINENGIFLKPIEKLEELDFVTISTLDNS